MQFHAPGFCVVLHLLTCKTLWEEFASTPIAVLTLNISMVDDLVTECPEAYNHTLKTPSGIQLRIYPSLRISLWVMIFNYPEDLEVPGEYPFVVAIERL